MCMHRKYLYGLSTLYTSNMKIGPQFERLYYIQYVY